VVLVVLGVIIIPFSSRVPLAGFHREPAAHSAAERYHRSAAANTPCPEFQHRAGRRARGLHGCRPHGGSGNDDPAARPVVHASSCGGIGSGRRAPSNGKWVVQVGSYGSQANADKVVATLKQHGIHASVSHFSKAGHTYYRVRVGPYAERADADKALGSRGKGRRRQARRGAERLRPCGGTLPPIHICLDTHRRREAPVPSGKIGVLTGEAAHDSSRLRHLDHPVGLGSAGTGCAGSCGKWLRC